VQREAAVAVLPDFPAPAGPPLVFSLSDSRALEGLMRDAGFVDVVLEVVPGTDAFESPEGEWDLVSASPVFDAVESSSRDRLDLVHDELIRLVRE
jgi:hypothetical protein